MKRIILLFIATIAVILSLAASVNAGASGRWYDRYDRDHRPSSVPSFYRYEGTDAGWAYWGPPQDNGWWLADKAGHQWWIGSPGPGYHVEDGLPVLNGYHIEWSSLIWDNRGCPRYEIYPAP